MFTSSDLQVLSDPHASDPAADLGRVRLRDRLVELHRQIYPEMRVRRWDLHPHWVPRYLISTARLEPPFTRIDFLLLRYGKAETVVRMMKKEFGEDFSHPYSTALIGVQLDQNGLAVELLVTDRAWVDAENFKNKLASGAPEKRHIRQLLADLGPDYILTFETPARQEILRMHSARLVNLGTLDATVEKFHPRREQLRVAIRYRPDDPRLDGDALATEMLLRLGQLYLLYQFVSWSPRNDYLSFKHFLARQQVVSSAPPLAGGAEDETRNSKTESKT